MNETVSGEMIVKLLQARSESALPLLRSQYEERCRRVAGEVFLLCEKDFEECFYSALRSVWHSDPPDCLPDLSFSVEKAMRNAIVWKLEKNVQRKQCGGSAGTLFDRGIGLEDSRDFVNEEIPEPSELERIAEYLEMQPETARSVFVARYWHLFSVREIAERFSLSQEEVTESLAHTCEALKVYLEEHEA